MFYLTLVLLIFFISASCVDSLGLKVERAENSLLIKSLMGMNSSVDKICKKCVITLTVRAIRIDMRVLEIFGYDVILGMDWLSVYRDLIDCHHRRIIFCSCYHNVLRKGSISILACLHNKEKLQKDIVDISMVRKFQDVFPDELPGLPPDKVFDFSIEVYPWINPILVAPYRMVPVELKELKTQLEE